MMNMIVTDTCTIELITPPRTRLAAIIELIEVLSELRAHAAGVTERAS